MSLNFFNISSLIPFDGLINKVIEAGTVTNDDFCPDFDFKILYFPV